MSECTLQVFTSPKAVPAALHFIAHTIMTKTLRDVPVRLIWLGVTLLYLSRECDALIKPTDHDCSGVKRLHSSGVELLDATACSTNRALGYAIGKQFRKSIAERISKLGPQLVKAVVRRFIFTLCYRSHTTGFCHNWWDCRHTPSLRKAR